MRTIQLYTYGTMALLCFLGSCFVGCASIHYQSPTGEAFSYNRLGLQKLEGFAMTKNEQGVVNVSFTKQEGVEAITPTINKALDITASALSKIP